MQKIIPWREALADYFRQHSFEDFDTREQSVAEKAVEFYQKEMGYELPVEEIAKFIKNEKSNERGGVSGLRKDTGRREASKKPGPESKKK